MTQRLFRSGWAALVLFLGAAAVTAEDFRATTPSLRIVAEPEAFRATTPPIRIVAKADTYRVTSPPLRIMARSHSYRVTTPPLRIVAKVDTYRAATPPICVVAKADTYRLTSPALRIVAKADTCRATAPPLRIVAKVDTYRAATPPLRIIGKPDAYRVKTAPLRIVGQLDTKRDDTRPQRPYAQAANLVCPALLSCSPKQDILRVEADLISLGYTRDAYPAFCGDVAQTLGTCPETTTTRAPGPVGLPGETSDIPAADFGLMGCPPLEAFAIDLQRRSDAGENTKQEEEKLIRVIAAASALMLTGRADLWCEEVTANLP